MIPAVDARTAVEVCTSVGSAVAVVVSLRNDMRWLKRWAREHQHADEVSFEDARSQIAELRTVLLNHRQESAK